MESLYSRLSIRGLEALIPNRLDGHVDVWLRDLDTLEFFVLEIQLVYFIDDICWLVGVGAESSEVLLRKICLVLCLISVNSGAYGWLANAWVSGKITVNGSGS